MKKICSKKTITVTVYSARCYHCHILIIQLSPIDPAVRLAGGNARVEDIEAIREQLGLNQPLLEQFWNYIVNLFHGDFGRSFLTKTAVSKDILKALINTIYLMVLQESGRSLQPFLLELLQP